MAHSFDGALAGLTSALPLPSLSSGPSGRVSAWARGSAVDELARKGITPIPIEKGLDSLRKLLCRKSANVAAVVMGRLRDMPTLKVEGPTALPALPGKATRLLSGNRVGCRRGVVDDDRSISTTTSSAESVCCPP